MSAAVPAARSESRPGAVSRREAIVICVIAAVVVLMGAGLCSLAILVPAPAAVVPLIAVSCAGLPLLAGWRLPGAVAALGRRPQLSLDALRRDLDRLPETDHPFGL